MELQLALDFVTLPEALEILGEVGDIIDIAEAGTPLIVEEGMRAVRVLREAYPKHKILADLKIMDAGERETGSAIKAGADIVTVLGVANDATIIAAAGAARKAGKEIMVDMIDVPDIERRAAEIDLLGVSYICVHTAFDIQGTGANPLDELIMVNRVVKNAKTAVAGGVKLSTIGGIVPLNPSIVIVGGGITSRKDMRNAAEKIKKAMENAL